MEGVTQYISAEAVDAIFRYISRVSTPDSRIIFTYIKRSIIDGNLPHEERKSLLQHHKLLGEPWIYGIDPEEISSFLNNRGFSLINQVGASEYRERYLNPTGRKMNIFDGEFAAIAQIKETKNKVAE